VTPPAATATPAAKCESHPGQPHSWDSLSFSHLNCRLSPPAPLPASSHPRCHLPFPSLLPPHPGHPPSRAAEDGARGGQGRVDPSPSRPSGEIRRRRAIPSPTAAQVTGRDLPWGTVDSVAAGDRGATAEGLRPPWTPCSMPPRAVRRSGCCGRRSSIRPATSSSSSGTRSRPRSALDLHRPRRHPRRIRKRAPPLLPPVLLLPRPPPLLELPLPAGTNGLCGMRLSAASAGGASSLSFPQEGLVVHGGGEHCWS
jgi:hypothetical protein